MKTGKNLVELATEIARRADAKKDLIAKTSAIVMQAEDSKVRLQIGSDIQVGVNGVAHDQIGTHLEIPAKYYDKMLADEPKLLATNVNAWFQKYPVPRMVRTLDGTARAFLSDRYRPLENEDLAQAVLPVLMDLNLEIMSSEITDNRLYIKAVDQSVAREVKARGGAFGDGQHNIVRMLAPAITISNSEVGKGALSILGGVYDGFCTNLATFGERSVRKSHVGGKHVLGDEALFAMLSAETREVSDKALWLQIADVVRGTFEMSRFDSLVNKITETQDQKIEGDVVEVVRLTSRKLGINETEGKSVLRHLIEGGDLTRFGIYNAITRTAQDLEDYDRASDFERLGANIIELPSAEWKVLAAAA